MKRLVAAILLAATLGACGGGHSVHGAQGGRTIDIDMRENDFSPASVTVASGEQVQFVFHNKGAVVHDAYIGDEHAQMAHEQEMRMSSGDPGHGHGSEGVTVEPGKTATLSHTFDTSGNTLIGCHELGHYALGMRIRVVVT
ncbi:MAG: hypothetical protein QOD92_3524 [Acidimicrobiaceae bacterium]|jgi:uncharacterized cupredoxin-like copper-binding protein